jgi:hypothetical protein
MRGWLSRLAIHRRVNIMTDQEDRNAAPQAPAGSAVVRTHTESGRARVVPSGGDSEHVERSRSDAPTSQPIRVWRRVSTDDIGLRTATEHLLLSRQQALQVADDIYELLAGDAGG